MTRNKLVKDSFKAIEWYAGLYGLVPQLSTVKDVRFKDRRTGEYITIELSELTVLYHHHLQEERTK